MKKSDKLGILIGVLNIFVILLTIMKTLVGRKEEQIVETEETTK